MICFSRSVLGVVALFCSLVYAQQPPQLEDPAPGEIFLTPAVDLGLVETPVGVPAQFRSSVPEGAVLYLPQGFQARIFAAEGLRGPRMMAFSPAGVLHVANMKVGDASEFGAASDGRSGQIVALPDADRDGIADRVVVVADTHELLRLTDGDGTYEGRQVLAQIPTGGQHVTRTLAIDRINRKMYLSVGSSDDVLREVDPERATILQFGPDGTGRRIFSRGWRNAVGMVLHPLSNELWATNNGHDREGREPAAREHQHRARRLFPRLAAGLWLRDLDQLFDPAVRRRTVPADGSGFDGCGLDAAAGSAGAGPPGTDGDSLLYR